MNDSFYFIRHGQSQNNKNQLVNGWYDSPLSSEGIADIHNIKSSFLDRGITKIYTSDLSRATDTADIIKNEIGDCVVYKIYNLRERNWGIYENTERNNISDFFIHPIGGESWEMFYDRVKLEINGLDINKNTLIVAHAGIMRVIRKMLGIGNILDTINNTKPIRFYKNNNIWNYEHF